MAPTLFKLGPLTFYSYGLMVALGFLLASWVAARRARAMGLDPARIQNVTLWGLLAGIAGARGAYVAMNWAQYRGSLPEIIRLDHGGLVFYGGVAAGLPALVWLLRRDRLPLWETVDLLIPPVVLAHALGRIGCFLNGCCYGKPADLPWAVAFPREGIPRHPTQLYESAFLFMLFFFLKRLESRVHRPGGVLLVYLLVYGGWRFGIEFLRDDHPRVFAGWTAFQLVSMFLVGFCACLLLRPSRR